MISSRVKSIQQIIFYSVIGVMLLVGYTVPSLHAQNLQEHFPEEIAGLERNNDVTINETHTTATASYNSDDHPYIISIQLSAGDYVQKADSLLSQEVNKPDSNLEEHTYNGSIIYLRTEKSSVTHLSYTDDYLLAIEALVPREKTINSDRAKVHLIRIYDKLIPTLR